MATKSKKITTVDELVTRLKNKPDNVGYLDVMQLIDIPLAEFERYYTWKDNKYTRNCLVKTKSYELLLICMEKGQSSPIHDFSSKEAWVHPIQGKLREERFYKTDDGLQQVSSVTLEPGDYSYMTDPISIHRYINNHESRTVCLNLYAKPIEKWWEYDPQTGKSKEMPVACDVEYKLDIMEKSGHPVEH